MRFHGLDPRTRLTRWGLVAVALGIVLGATSPRIAHDLLAALATHRSSMPWLLERLAAFLAYLAMSGSVVYGLLLSTRLLDAIAHRPITFALHQDLAAIGLGLAGIHGALLGLDATVPFSLPQIAVPGLAPYAMGAVALGQVAFYLTIVIVASFYARRMIGQRAWRGLHFLTLLVYAGATAHGILAGTDSGSAWSWWLYAGSVVIVTFLLVYRVVMAIAGRGVRQRASVPGSAG
ncbi:MAG TPA: hypothetical protein VIV06_09660 [Candidatus Limnocylindrales bacterium]